jgi:hypothetical protein
VETLLGVSIVQADDPDAPLYELVENREILGVKGSGAQV